MQVLPAIGKLYSHRWQVESEIRVFKAHGLESYMARKLRTIRLWIMAVWHVVLPLLRNLIEGHSCHAKV